jgi:general secretion pathway protein D
MTPREAQTSHNVPEAGESRRRRHNGHVAAWVLGAATIVLAASASPAMAQPATRGAPILKTPGKPGAAPPTGPGAAVPPGRAGGAPVPPPPGPGAKPPTGGSAGSGGDADPMASVKQGPKEIDFKPKPGNFGVNFNLDDADLPDLVKAISNITGKRFIYGGKLRSIKATVYSPEKISAGEAYSAFLSILDTNGMTVIPHGRFLKIIESPGVVQDTTEIYGTASPVPNEDRYLTRLYRLAHIDATEASNVLSKFKTKEGDITVVPASNLLIITETGTNIRRMMRIIEEIDVGSAGEQIYVEALNYTAATEMATKLNDLLDLKKGGSGAGGGAKGAATGGGGGGGARIVADEKGNALIIVASDPDYRRLLELINRLDVKQTGEGEIRVSPLQYAAARISRRRSTRSSGRAPESAASARPGRRDRRHRGAHPGRGRRGRGRGHLRGQHPRGLRRGHQLAGHHLLAPRLRAAPQRHRSSSITRAARCSSRP